MARDTCKGHWARETCKGHWAKDTSGSEMGFPRIYLLSFFALLSIINLLAAQEVK